MLEQSVAEGVHRVQDSYVNWYLVWRTTPR